VRLDDSVILDYIILTGVWIFVRTDKIIIIIIIHCQRGRTRWYGVGGGQKARTIASPQRLSHTAGDEY
jgi:hypothetical protein